MARNERQYRSRSLALYALLIKLYPRDFLRRHRAELLQNFEDLVPTSPMPALWLLIGKDLMTSLISYYAKLPLTKYVIGVLVAWGLFFAVGYWRHGLTPGHPVLHVFGGFMLGMLAMYIAMRFYRSPPSNADSAAHD